MTEYKDVTMRYFKYIIVNTLLINSAFAQEVLSLANAVQTTLENNYNIKVAENNKLAAENNASIYNSGYLPTVAGRGGASINSKNSEIENHDGTSRSTLGENTVAYNASVGLNYTLFDGMYRTYNYKKMKELDNLSELQVRQIIEGTLLELFTAYYTVASLAATANSFKQSLEISKQRLTRAQYKSDYGQNTQLDVLNAQVDVNTDSINYLNGLQSLANAKRNLNVIIRKNVNTDFEVDTTVSYNVTQSINELYELAKQQNTKLQVAQKNIDLSKYDIKLFQTNRIPTIGFGASYGYSHNNFNTNANPTVNTMTTLGPSAELSLTWNIFDGGRTKVGVQNAKIQMETHQLLQEQTYQNIERDVTNAYTTFQNSMFVLKAEKANLHTNKRNFERSQEQYQLGQLTSIDFRQAQLNLLRAETSYNQAKYTAKIYELAIHQLIGGLLDLKF